MEFSLEQVAAILNGQIVGNADKKVKTISNIEEAKEGSITFLSNPKYEPFIYKTEASAVIVNEDFEPREALKVTIIKVKDAYSGFTRLLEEYQKIISYRKKGIEQPAYIADSATYGEEFYLGAFSYLGQQVKIGNNVKIYPQVYIGDYVEIGDNTIIYPGVKIYARCKVGHYCTVQAGAIIGSDGFGFAPQDDGSYKTIPQTGNVILKDHVDVGANTTIDCATFDSTIIEKGVKLDNLIQIAHNVEIGENTVIASQTGISGSTKIGKQTILAGQVGIVGHITIGDHNIIAAQSGVTKNTPSGVTLMGSPAYDKADYVKSLVVYKKLPDIWKRLNLLEEKILNLPTKK